MSSAVPGPAQPGFRYEQRWRTREEAEEHRRRASWRVEHPTLNSWESINVHNRERFSGVRDALSWVLGETDIAPITHRHMPALSDKEVCSEWFYGLDVIETHRAPNGLTFTYGEAVYRALNWFRGFATEKGPADYEY